MASSGLALGIGLLTLVGWAFDVQPLRTALHHAASMKPNTALCIILLAADLIQRTRANQQPRRERWANGAAVLVVVIGAVTLLQDLTGWNAGIDELLWRDPDSHAGQPGRMAPTTAASALLLGAASLSMNIRPTWYPRPSECLASAALLIAMASLLGYLYELAFFHSIANFTPIAPHTAVSVLLLSFASLIARPRHGALSIVASDTATARAARPFIPLLAVLPIALGWFSLWGARRGHYSSEAGLAFFTLANVVCLIAIALLALRALGLAERRRIQLVQRLADQALSRSEATFHTLVESAPIGLLVSRERRVVYANAALLDMFGYRESADLSGRSLFDLLHSDAHAPALERLRVLERGENLAPALFRGVHRDGSDVFVESRTIGIHFEGKPSTLGLVRDVTALFHAEEARASAEAALRASLQEKETLLREIHHRVKNNLQVVASLLSLQVHRLPEEPELRAPFEETRARVQAIAMLHERLYSSKSLARIEMRTYLEGVVQSLCRASLAERGAVHVEIECADIELDIDTALPVGLIVNELVTNAIKHAFPPRERAGGAVQVVLLAEAGNLALSVCDDGVGLRAGLDPTSTASLGMQLVRGLARQLRGDLSWDGTRGFSCQVRFSAPVNAVPARCANSRDGAGPHDLLPGAPS